MSLKTVLKTLDGLDEAHKAMYKEQDDGTFILDVEGVDDHPSIKNLKSALEKQKLSRKTIADQLAAVTEQLAGLPEGFNSEQYTALVEMKDELEALKKDKGGGGSDDKVASLQRIHEQKLAAEKKKADEVLAKSNARADKNESMLRKLLVDDGLTKALVEAGVTKEYLKAAKSMLKDNAVIEEDEGEYTAKIKTADGNVDLNTYVRDWTVSEEGRVFVKPPTGGGAEGAGGGGRKDQSGDTNPWADKTFNLTEQGRILKADRAKAERLAKAAGKLLPPVAA